MHGANLSPLPSPRRSAPRSREDLVENPDAALQLLARDDERRHETDHVRSSRGDKQVALARRRDEGSGGLRQLDPPHPAAPPPPPHPPPPRPAARGGPSPHCTSSKISATPRPAHSSRTNASHSGSTGRTPPSPCSGSTITAAVRDAEIA